jgi:hypothetical protein
LRIYWHALCSALAAAAAETGKDVLRKELPCAVDSCFPLCYYQCLMLSRENGKVIVPLVAEFLAMFAQVHNTNGFLERNLKHGNSETIPRIYNGLRWTPFF